MMAGISPISVIGSGAYNTYFHPAMNRVNMPHRTDPVDSSYPIRPISALPESNKTAIGWAINSFQSIMNFFSQTKDNQAKNNVSEIQKQCPVCCNREYTCSNGETTDGKKAIIPGHESVERVRQHEAEHLRIARMNAGNQGKMVIAQHINTITEKCPECGEIFVAKGEAITETVEMITTRSGTYHQFRNQSNGPNMRLEGVGRLFDGYG